MRIAHPLVGLAVVLAMLLLWADTSGRPKAENAPPLTSKRFQGHVETVGDAGAHTNVLRPDLTSAAGNQSDSAAGLSSSAGRMSHGTRTLSISFSKSHSHLFGVLPRCGVMILNPRNVGHIYGDVLPAVLDPSNRNCTLVMPSNVKVNKYLGYALFSIASQLNITLSVATSEQFERGGTAGVDFVYHPNLGTFVEGYRRLSSIVGTYIKEVCRCPEYPLACNVTKVTIFNRVRRPYLNYIALLSRLQGLANMSIEWNYIPNTTRTDQCWHFCQYRNSSLVFTPYGAEIMYPFITNRSSIIMGYHGRRDVFYERILASYGMSRGGHISVLNASRILEDAPDYCYKRWMDPPVEYESFLHHKCGAHYMDQVFLDQSIEAIFDDRRRTCRREVTY